MTKSQKRKLEPDEMHLFVHGWPRKLQKKLRMAAASYGCTLKDIVTEACEDWLKNRKGK